jgi:hypothetical protein
VLAEEEREGMTSDNPYESPQPIADTVPSAAPREAPPYLAWTLVFGINLLVPLLLSANVGAKHGTRGIAVAVLVLLAAGLVICAVRPGLARIFIGGSVVTAVLQFVPIVQMTVGMIAITLLEDAGLMSRENDWSPPAIESDLGGFVLTTMVGAGLLAAALQLGLLVDWWLPKRKVE